MNHLVRKEGDEYIIIPTGERIKMSSRYKTKRKQEKELARKLKELGDFFEEEKNKVHISRRKLYPEIPIRVDRRTVVYVQIPECFLEKEWIYRVGGVENMLEKIRQFKK